MLPYYHTALIDRREMRDPVILLGQVAGDTYLVKVNSRLPRLMGESYDS